MQFPQKNSPRASLYPSSPKKPQPVRTSRDLSFKLLGKSPLQIANQSPKKNPRPKQIPPSNHKTHPTQLPPKKPQPVRTSRDLSSTPQANSPFKSQIKALSKIHAPIKFRLKSQIKALSKIHTPSKFPLKPQIKALSKIQCPKQIFRPQQIPTKNPPPSTP
jgi:hypothetical protein